MSFTKENRATVAFELEWESRPVRHRDRVLVPRADLWKDIVPERIEEALTGAQAGDRFEFAFPPGAAVPEYRDEDLLAVRAGDVRRPRPFCGEPLRFGRFYPRGVLAASGRFFREDLRPVRAIGLDGEWIVVDPNHPLARFPLTLRAEIVRVFDRGNMLGGSCASWLDLVTLEGPGMQGRWREQPTDFGEEDASRREDEEDDSLFYASARLVGHVDRRAGLFLAEEYARRIPDGGRVLDLMSSVESHLPEAKGLHVTGLGLNGEEMEHNPLLREMVVHDLNRSPALPFADGVFDAVVCSLSWEYLTRPGEVLAGVSRVLAPGGLLFIGLSDRWFPPKVTRLWTHLHEFERVGLVLEHLFEDGSFTGFETLSVRGWPRPSDDRHYGSVRVSDPVYVVSAVREPGAARGAP